MDTVSQEMLQPEASQPVPPPPPPKKNNLLLWILFVILFFGSGWGLYLTARDQGWLPFGFSPTPTPVAIVQPTPILDPTVSWKTYVIQSLGLSYRLPPEITSLGNIQEFVNTGETGTQLLISIENSKIIANKKLLMGTTSIDYSAGRGGMFIDLQGFRKENGRYYAKFVDNKSFEIPIELVTEVKNLFGLEVIKIIGKSETSGEALGLPIAGTPGEGKIGALINVNKYPYQGLAIQMDITQELSEQLFDQILSAFRFIDQTTEPGIYKGKYFSIGPSNVWRFKSDINQSPSTPEVLETVTFANNQANLNIQVGTDPAEKVLASQDGDLAGTTTLNNVTFAKKAGYGGIAGSVYSTSLVGSNNGKTYILSYYTLDSQNIANYNKDFDQILSTFKFTD